MSGAPTYYITTPIYYVNDKPHIGHAYTTLACDVLARFKRLDGYRVMFLTGTDEHGQKVAKSAAAIGVEPKEFADKVSENFRHLAQALGFSHDDFIRTTEDRHHRACQAIWQKLMESGDLYLETYEGWYAVRDEAYYQESELTKRPDGSFIAPTGAEVEWVQEPSYFFRLSAWGDRLLKFYEENPGFIQPESRRNEVLSFVKGGLKDLSVSRTTFSWGVPVPGDEKHVMYVWLDALTNYITAVGYPDQDPTKFADFWPADVHMIGKDIIRFHAVYWPAFLMSAGITPPKRVFAHGWWTNEGQKISKSLGNVIDPLSLVEKYGLDPVRYFLMREVPFGQDGDFSHKAMVQRMNSELANDLGNLCQRVLSMVHKNCDGALPVPGHFSHDDQELLHRARNLLPTLRVLIDEQALHKALTTIWEVVAEANRYVDAQAPWTLKKTDPKKMETVLFTLVETIRRVAIAVTPYMPHSAERILDQIFCPETMRDFSTWDEPFGIISGAAIDKPEGIFPRFVEEEAA